MQLALPGEMMVGLEQFKRFHEDTNQKMRRLTWQLGLGSVVIKASFDKVYELQLQPVQAAVLLCFNDAPTLAFSELQASHQGNGACHVFLASTARARSPLPSPLSVERGGPLQQSCCAALLS